MSATPATGNAPLTVAFSGTGSTDPDGTITSWSWSFGDRQDGWPRATTSHVYSTAGTFTAALTVTDNDGASSTTSTPIVVSGGGPQTTNPVELDHGWHGWWRPTFADEDIVSVDTGASGWSMYPRRPRTWALAAPIWTPPSSLPMIGRILLSTESPVVLGGVTYDDSDVISFTPSSTGATTAGAFSLYLSGATIGLTVTAENVDAVAITAQGELLLSTVGRLSGGGVVAEDEDSGRGRRDGALPVPGWIGDRSHREHRRHLGSLDNQQQQRRASRHRADSP